VSSLKDLFADDKSLKHFKAVSIPLVKEDLAEQVASKEQVKNKSNPSQKSFSAKAEVTTKRGTT
jgi:hypothetical protein